MDERLFIYLKAEEDYPMLLNTIIEYLKETLHENIECRRVDQDIEDIHDRIVCSLFIMYITTQFTNKEWDPEYTVEEYQIETNIEFYINIGTVGIIEGENVLKGMIKRLEVLNCPNIIFEDDSGKAVYIYSSNQKYLDKEFWNLE